MDMRETITKGTKTMIPALRISSSSQNTGPYTENNKNYEIKLLYFTSIKCDK